jgi:hypothetical protein
VPVPFFNTLLVFTMLFVLKPVASSLKPLLAAFIALAACLGCSKGASYPHGAAAGMVTVDGQPAPHGTITFNPVVTPGTNEIKPVTGATIEDGHYRCERVPIGKLTATFTLHGAGMRKFVDGTGVPREVPIDILPPQYRTGIPTTVHEGDNTLDFALTTKPGR